jgi:hypothetical protein
MANRVPPVHCLDSFDGVMMLGGSGDDSRRGAGRKRRASELSASDDLFVLTRLPILVLPRLCIVSARMSSLLTSLVTSLVPSKFGKYQARNKRAQVLL